MDPQMLVKPSSSMCNNSVISASSGQSDTFHRRKGAKLSITSSSGPQLALKATKLGKRRRKKDSKKSSNCSLLYLKLNKGVASGALNRINKVQLSILNTGLINIDEEGEKASGIIPQKPFDLTKPRFRDHVKLLHKYMVLLKIEFHVSVNSNLIHFNNPKIPLTKPVHFFRSIFSDNKFYNKLFFTNILSIYTIYQQLN